MSSYFTKDGEPFIPESINPELVKICAVIIKNCHLKVKYQMRTSALSSALKGGKSEHMKETALKCIEKNKPAYNQDMSLTGIKITDIDDAFFTSTLKLLIDFAAINTVVEAGLIRLLAAACEKQTGTPLNKTYFFTNQTEVLDDPDDEESDESTENEEK